MFSILFLHVLNPNEPEWFNFFLKEASILFSEVEKKKLKRKKSFQLPPIGLDIKENIFYPFMNNSYFVNDSLQNKSHYYISVVESSVIMFICVGK